jgi:hypothetical protein
MSLDFDKLIQSWTKESTDPVLTMFDQMFGTIGLYTFTHEFFENSVFYVSSRLNPPSWMRKNIAEAESEIPFDMMNINADFPPDPLVWVGQKGGLEGLRQKGWTCIIMGALYAVEYINGIKSTITGQGDNQVLLVEMPIDNDEGLSTQEYCMYNDSQISTKLAMFSATLKDTCAGLGMKLKLEETWTSTRLLNFGKEIYFDGILLTNVLKKLGRLFPESNDVYPTLNHRVASVYSAAHTATGKDVVPVLNYWIAQAECHRILRKSLTSKYKDSNLSTHLSREGLCSDVKQLFLIFALSNDVGGYSVISFPDFLYRGHPDPLTSYLVWVKFLASTNSQFKRICEWIVSGEHFKTETNLADCLRLIQDPASLNFVNAPGHAAYIRDLLERKVAEIVQNKEIKKVYNIEAGNTRDQLVQYLSTIRPFFPRVLGDIFRHSTEGAKLALISRFTDMKTIKSLLDPQGANDLISSLEIQDTNKQVFVMKILTSVLRGSYKGHVAIEANHLQMTRAI